MKLLASKAKNRVVDEITPERVDKAKDVPLRVARYSGNVVGQFVRGLLTRPTPRREKRAHDNVERSPDESKELFGVAVGCVSLAAFIVLAAIASSE